MAKEIQIPHDQISDPQTITQVQERIFKENGVDMHVNITEKVEDDHSARKRIVKIKNTKYFGPWSHRG